jgi:transposase-like protein
MPRRERKDRTGAEQLRLVQEAARLDEAAQGALLRREGLQPAALTAWQQAAEQALDAKPVRPKAGPSAEAKRVQEPERELARNERAVAS